MLDRVCWAGSLIIDRVCWAGETSPALMLDITLGIDEVCLVGETSPAHISLPLDLPLARDGRFEGERSAAERSAFDMSLTCDQGDSFFEGESSAADFSLTSFARVIVVSPDNLLIDLWLAIFARSGRSVTQLPPT